MGQWRLWQPWSPHLCQPGTPSFHRPLHLWPCWWSLCVPPSIPGQMKLWTMGPHILQPMAPQLVPSSTPPAIPFSLIQVTQFRPRRQFCLLASSQIFSNSNRAHPLIRADVPGKSWKVPFVLMEMAKDFQEFLNLMQTRTSNPTTLQPQPAAKLCTNPHCHSIHCHHCFS